MLRWALVYLAAILSVIVYGHAGSSSYSGSSSSNTISSYSGSSSSNTISSYAGSSSSNTASSYSGSSSSNTIVFPTITTPAPYSLPGKYANATPMALIDAGGGHLSFHWFTPAMLDSMYYIYVNGSYYDRVIGISNDYTLEGLACNTTYMILVIDMINTNMVNIMTATTTPATAPSRPPTPSIAHIDSGYVVLKIGFPVNTGGVPLALPLVIYAETEDVNPFQPPFKYSNTTHYATIYGLHANTEYFFTIAVTNEQNYTSEQSYPAIIETLDATYPGLCPAPVLLSATAGMVQLKLLPPLDTGGSDIYGYHIFVGTNSTYTEIAFATTEVIYLYNEAFGQPWKSQENYTFRVLAVNALPPCALNDTSLLGEPLNVLIPPPATPDCGKLNVYLVNATSSALTLQILLPYDMQGTIAMGIYINVNEKTSFVSTNDSVVTTITGLNASTLYGLSFTLLTNLGNSTSCDNTFMASTLVGSPPQMPLLSGVMNITASSVVIEWLLPDDTGGGSVSEYRFHLTTLSFEGVDQPWLSLATPVTRVQQTIITGLQANTTYSGQLIIKNIFGLHSLPSAPALNFTTAEATVSEPPTGLNIVRVTGGMVDVAWSPPGNTGGLNEALVYYIVIANATHNFSCTTISTSCAIYGLQSSTYYNVTGQAANSIGVSMASTPVLILTSYGTLPGNAQNITAQVLTGGTIFVSWTTPLDTGDGSSALLYKVYRNNSLLTSITGSGAMNYTDCNQILAGVTYNYSIVAANSIGMGSPTTTTVVASVMDPPKSPVIALQRTQATTLTYSFQPSCDTGGTNILWYYAQWYVVNTTMSLMPMLTISPSATSFVVSGLTPGQSYEILVWAANYAGESDMTIAIATTAFGFPIAPSSYLVVATSYTLEMALVFPVDYSEDTITYDAVLSNSSGFSTEAILYGNRNSTTHWTVCNLTAASTYQLSVRSIGIASVSSPATTSYTTLLDVPGSPTFTTSSFSVVNGSDVILLNIVRVGGSGGSLFVPLSFTTQPLLYPLCSMANTVYTCSFTSVPQFNTTNFTFSSGQTVQQLQLNTWNSQIVKNVPNWIAVSMNGEYNTSVMVSLYGLLGVVTAPASITIYENTSTYSIPLHRVNGSSGFLNATVVAINGSAQNGVDFSLVSNIIAFAPGQLDASIVLSNISSSPVYNPNGRQFMLQLTQFSLADPLPLVVVNLTVLDDPSSIKVPLACTNITVLQATGAAIAVQWVPPPFGMTSDAIYMISMTQLTSGNAINITATHSQVSIYELSPMSNYIFQVTAINSKGSGPLSPPQMISTTMPTPPSAPLNLMVVSRNASSLGLQWLPPNDSGGYAIVGYTIMIQGPEILLSLNLTPTFYTATNLSATTTYTISLRAVSTMLGAITTITSMTAPGQAPNQPPSPQLLNATGGALYMTIVPPFDSGGLPLTNYSLYIRSENQPFQLTCFGSSPNCSVYGLVFNTVYFVYTTVSNAAGVSAPSIITPFSTKPSMTLPSAPTPPVLITATSSSVWLSWTPPLDFGGTNQLIGYQVRMGSYLPELQQWTPSTVVQAITLPPTTPSISQTSLLNLQSNTKYAFSIVAMSPISLCTNGFNPSQELIVTTLPPVPPSAPANLVQVSSTGSSVEIAWSPPMDFGGTQILNYTISLSLKNGSIVPLAILPPSILNYTLYGLSSRTPYLLVVAALNAVGSSPNSIPCNATTSWASPPGPPTNLTVLQNGGGFITLTWQPPNDNGGATLLGYNVYRGSSMLATMITATLFTDSTSLTNGTSYIYSISAVNSQYEGTQAIINAFTAVTPDIPKPPFLSIRNATGGSIAVSLAMPTNLGGGVVLSTLLQLFWNGQLISSSQSSNPIFYGLNASTSYLVQGYLTTTGGTSFPQNITVFTTGLSTPSTPLAIVQHAVRGGSVDFYLNSPLDFGGGSIQMNLYQLSSGGVLEKQTYSFTTTTLVTITGLLANHFYQFWTTAINSVGESLSSPVLIVATTNITSPGTVSQVYLQVATYRSLSLSWQTPNDTGGDINGIASYNVTVSTAGTIVQNLVTTNPSIQINGLEQSTMYTIQVAALNSASYGPWSSPFTFATDYAAPGTLNMALANVSILETMSQVTITILRSNGTAGDISVDISVVADSAHLDVDFGMPNSLSLSFDDEVASQTLSIPIYHDPVYNNLARFFVSLSAITSATGEIGPLSTTTVYILDCGDDGTVNFGSATQSLNENDTLVSLPLIRSSGTSKMISLEVYTLTPTTAIRILTPLVQFKDGQSQALVNISGVPNFVFDYPYRIASLGIRLGEGSFGHIGSVNIATLQIYDEGDVSGANDTALPPVLINATGGMMSLQVQQPFHPGGYNQTITYYSMTIYALPGMQVLTVQNQTTPIFSFGSLTAMTSYAFSSAMWNTNGFPSLGASTIWSSSYTTTAMSSPGPPQSIIQTRATGGTVDVCWQPPLDTGGVPITGYIVYNGSMTTAYNGTGNPETCAHISGLNWAALSNYSLYIQAINLASLKLATGSLAPFGAATANTSMPNELVPIVTTSIGPDVVELQFNLPKDTGGIEILNYTLYINETSALNWVNYTTVTNHLQIAELTALTTYMIKYTASNINGTSMPSQVSFFKTTAPTIPSKPLLLMIDSNISTTGGCISLTWLRPISTGGLPLIEYDVLMASGNSTDFAVVSTVAAPKRTSTICGLVQNSTYTFKTIAYNSASYCYGSINELDASIPLTTSTALATPPANQSAPAIQDVSGGMIALVWSSPQDTGGISIENYLLYSITSTGLVLLATIPGNLTLSYDVYGLKVATSYQYQLIATNAVGMSALSPILTATTLTSATAPTAPMNLRSTNQTGGAITLQWDPVLDTGGVPITNYYIYRNSIRVGQTNGDTTFTDISGLIMQTTYSYIVTGFNGQFYGSQSDPILVSTTSATLPTACTNFNVIGLGGAINASWSAGGDTGGISINRYVVVLAYNNSVIKNTTVTVPTIQINFLLSQTNYVLTVQAINAIGVGPPVSVVASTTQLGPPGDIQTAPILSTTFGGNVSLTLTPPSNTGGGAQLTYILYQNKVLVMQIPVGNGSTMATVYGLQALTAYAFSYACRNNLGLGGQGPALSVTTLDANAPGSISSAPAISIVTSRSITLQWQLPADTGGSSTLVYELQAIETQTGNIQPSVWVTNWLNGTIPDLSIQTSYIVRVRPWSANKTFAGPWSANQTVATAVGLAGSISFDSSASSVIKNATTLPVPIIRSGGTVGTITVVMTTPTTPLLGNQFYLNSSNMSQRSITITFPDGLALYTVPIGIINDGIYRVIPSTFQLQLSSSSVQLGSNNTLTVTLLDAGNAGKIHFLSSYYDVMDTIGTVSIPIARYDGNSSSIQVMAKMASNASNEYIALPGIHFRLPTTPITFGDGQLLANLTITIRNTRVYSFPSLGFTVQLNMFSGGAVLGDIQQVFITINNFGASSAPGPPPAPVVNTVTGGAVQLYVTLPVNLGSANATISSFQITTTNVQTSAVTQTILPYTGSPYVWVGGLMANTQYSLTVAAAQSAFNQYGPPSPSVLFTTTPPSLAGPAQNISIASRTGGAINITWGLPMDTGGTAILDYRVQWVNAAGATQVAAVGSNKRTFVIYGLVANSAYPVQVQCYNAVPYPLTQGWGPYSSPVSLSTTNVTLPGTLKLYTTSATTTGGSITTFWDPPQDTGGATITGYHVFFKTMSSTSYTRANTALITNQQSFAVSGLLAATNYMFRVVAENTGGPLQLIGAFNMSSTAATVSTSADCRNILSGGDTILLGTSLFTISRVVANNILTVLEPNAYSTLVNARGYRIGKPSNAVTLSTTAPTIPGVAPAPILVQITGGAVYATIASPNDTGGIPVTSFKVQLYIISNNSAIQVDSTGIGNLTYFGTNSLQATTSVKINNLSPNTAYSIAVVALNAYSGCTTRQPDYSLPTNFTTLSATTCGAPENLYSILSTGAGLSLAWTQPFDTGGAPILSYTLQIFNKTNEKWTTVYQNSTASYRIANLATSTQYQWRLQATNIVNTSVWSMVWNLSTSGVSPPGPCLPPTNSSASGGKIQLVWDPPVDNGGSPITSYLVAQDDGSGGAFTWTSVSSNSYTAYGLTALTTYRFKIIAKNALGSGEQSPIAHLTTGNPSPPALPSSPTIVSATGGAVQLMITPPLDIGGVDPKSIIYQVFANGQNIANVTYAQLTAAAAPPQSRRLTTATGITVANLDASTTYQFGIAAVSPVGASSQSSPNIASTQPPTAPVAPPTPIAAQIFGGSLNIQWTSPIDEGGSPVISYKLYQIGIATPVCSGLIWSCWVTNLSPNTMYSFAVTATNAVNESPSSQILRATTALTTPPTAPRNLELVSVGSGGTSANIKWDAPLDGGGASLAYYKLLLTNTNSGQSTTIQTSDGITTTYPLTGLSTSTTYTLTLTAWNVQFSSSPISQSLAFSTPSGNGAPAAPIQACVSSTTMGLVWAPVDGSTSYYLYRGSTKIPVSTPYYTDTSLAPSMAYTYTLHWVNAQNVESVGVQVTFSTSSTTDSTCTATMGYITQGSYTNNLAKQWTILPSGAFTSIRLDVLQFDTECDHDPVRIEQFPFDGSRVLWKGGCTRVGTFTIYSSSATTPIRIFFTSDASVTKSGFNIKYVVNGDAPASTSVVCPTTANSICTAHGRCTASGRCTCNLGFTGEDCSNRLVCCVNPTICSNAVCQIPSQQVLVVSPETGSDTSGTGQMMDTSEISGTVAKPFATLAKALSVATDTSTIFLYPGTYGSASCGQTMAQRTITIQTLLGSNYTELSCSPTFGLSFSQCTASITGLTISYATRLQSGAGIAAANSVLSLQDVIVRNASSSANGGGLYITSGSTVTLNGSFITNSSSLLGGGIYMDSSRLVLINSVLTANTANNGGGIYGNGAINISGDSESSIKTNTASQCGGGLAMSSGANDLSLLSYLYLQSNAASFGGGLCLLGGTTNAQWNRLAIMNNTASTVGGGAYLTSILNLTSSNCSFVGNQASQNGGGLFINGTGQLVSPDVLTITQNQAGNGGGVYLTQSSFNLSQLLVSGNLANYGGGILATRTTSFFNNISISGNRANGTGGGLSIYSGSVVTGSNLLAVNNVAYSGGALRLSQSSLNGINITSNSALYQGGGGLLTSNANLLNAQITSSSSISNGGGLLIENSTSSTLTSVLISGCSSRSSGGAMAIANSTVQLVDSAMFNSSATNSGGGLFVSAATVGGYVNISNCSAVVSGGGLTASGTVYLSSVDITSCQAANGGGLAAISSTITLSRSNISHSNASSSGGALYASQSTLTLASVNLTTCLSTISGGGMSLVQSSARHSALQIDQCTTTGNGGGFALSSSILLPSTNTDIAQIQANSASSGGNGFVSGTSTASALRLQNGYAGVGGALYVLNAGTTLSKLTIQYNNATAIGGGMYIKGSTTIISSSTVTNNRVLPGMYGGGIVLDNALVSHSSMTIQNNIALNAAGVYGLGVSNFQGTGTVINANDVCSSHALNEICGNGGNFYVGALARVIASGLSLTNGLSYYGGSVYIAPTGQVTLNNVNIVNNTATAGGGLFGDMRSIVSGTYLVVSNNVANQFGGAIAVAGKANMIPSGSSAISLTHCTISNNTALSGNGGAIQVTFTNITTNDVTITDSTAQRGHGGAMSIDVNSNANLVATNMTNSHVDKDHGGGSVIIAGGSQVSISQSTIVSSSSLSGVTITEGGLIYITGSTTVVHFDQLQMIQGLAYFGGAIYIDAAKLYISESKITGCVATEFGGGFYLTDSAFVQIEDSTIENNTAHYNGGAVYLQGSSSLKLHTTKVLNNTAQDQGGGVFLDIGNANKLLVDTCTFDSNLASGLGSALFGSRDTITNITNSSFVNNGGLTIYGYNEGGPVYFETSFATISTTIFQNNIAITGGALEMYSLAVIYLIDCTFINNSATTDGGAIYQNNGTLILRNTTFTANVAIDNGGAVRLEDSALVVWDNIHLENNSAFSGGGIFLTDKSSIQGNGGDVTLNMAQYGGGFYLTGHATMLVTNIAISQNAASDTGGGFYFNTTNGVTHQSLTFTSNMALLGNDVFWRYDKNAPIYSCSGCSFSKANSLATDPMKLSKGWWPDNVTSGVEMTANLTTSDDWYNLTGKPWPTIITRDYYNNTSILDTSTNCQLKSHPNETDRIDIIPTSQKIATKGYITFDKAEIQATARPSPFRLLATCVLYNGFKLFQEIDIQVNPCQDGYSLSSGKCVKCSQGSFSLDGISCHPCPNGASCVETTREGNGASYSGVDFPSTQTGFFLQTAPVSKISALCDDKSSFQSGDPCPGGTPDTRRDRIRSCLNASSFSQYWPSDRVFTCSSGYSFYTCNVASACLSGIGKTLADDQSAKCAYGFQNVLCSSCIANYEKLADGSCVACTPSSPNAFYAYLSVPIIMFGIVIFGSYLYLKSGTDAVQMAHAKAAKDNIPFTYSNDLEDIPKTKLQQLRRRIWKGLKRLFSFRTNSFRFRKTPKNLFGIKRSRPPLVTISPEKFKILVTFFQIFANFKDNYEVSWPSQVSSFMQFFLKFNFSFLAIPHIDCVFTYSFYTDFELTLGFTVIIFTCLWLAYRAGIFIYQRKLHRIPRHCTKCGLPNWDLEPRQKSSRLRRASSLPAANASIFKKLWFKLRNLLEKDDMIEVLPTYSATHRQCPTTRMLESDVIKKKTIHTNIRLWQARIRLRMNFHTYQNKCWKIFFWLALVLYPAVSKKILDLFNCMEIGPLHYLVEDMNYICYTNQWYLHAGIGAVGILVWVIGVPALCYIILLRERYNGVRARMEALKDGKHDLARAKWIAEMKIDYESNGLHWNERNMAFVDELLVQYMKKRNLRLPNVVAGVGFIYHAYKDEFWYFEILDLIRKLFMNAIIVFAGQGTINQIVIGLIVIFVYMSIILALQPYKESSNNVVSSLAQMQLFITLFAGLLIRMNVGNAQSLNMDQVAMIIITSNAVTIAFIVLGVLHEKYKEIRLHKRICQRKYQDEVRFKVERLWWRAMTFALTDVYLAKMDDPFNEEKPQPSFRIALELARRQRLAEKAQEDQIRDAEPTN